MRDLVAHSRSSAAFLVYFAAFLRSGPGIGAEQALLRAAMKNLQRIDFDFGRCGDFIANGLARSGQSASGSTGLA
jgi:hypothetical protein